MPKRISKKSGQASRDIKPSASSVTNYNEREVVFSFKYLNNEFNNKLQDDDRKALLKTLHKISQLKWKEVHGSHRHGLGSELIKEKNDEIKEIVRKKDNIKDDLKAIAFRYKGKKKPMLGFRKDNIFFIVCLNCTYKH